MLVPATYRLPMCMPLGADLHWDGDQSTVLYATLRDDLLGEPCNRAGPPLEHCDLHAAFVIKVHVQGRDGHIVMIVKAMRQPLCQCTHAMVVNINQCSDALLFRRRCSSGLLYPGAYQIADRFGSVLVAAPGNEPVHLRHQIIVEGNRHTLHIPLPASGRKVQYDVSSYFVIPGAR